MSELIETLQIQTIEDALVNLFELTLSNEETIYFHSGFNASDTTQDFNVDPRQYAGTISFKSKNYAQVGDPINNYFPIPCQLEGAELSRDGPSNRPKIVIANVLDLFREELGDITNEDLLGKRVTIRTTLVKYLYADGNTPGATATDDGQAPVEFPRQTYIIDRIADLNPAIVSFELANPVDLPNVVAPARLVVGKYCSWNYRGRDSDNPVGGCFWQKSGRNPFKPQTSARYFFTAKDEPILPIELLTDKAVAYSAPNEYSVNDIVSVTANSRTYYYIAVEPVPAQTIPNTSSGAGYWIPARPYKPWNNLGETFNFYADDSFSSDYVLYPGINGGLDPANLVVEDSTVNEGIPTIWRCRKTHQSSNSAKPMFSSAYWEPAEVCGRTINSCKIRYQAMAIGQNKPDGNGGTIPNSQYYGFGFNARINYNFFDKDIDLPFGGFPGTVKFR